MTHSSTQTALFVTHSVYLQNGGGGAQWCTREYRSTLSRAGFKLVDVAFESRRDWVARFRHKFRPSPEGEIPGAKIAQEIAKRLSTTGAQLCFLNNSDAGLLAPRIREAAPSLRLVFLSHGVELTDMVNNLRIAPDAIAPSRRRPEFIGRLLQAELRQRQAIAATICISEPDELLEAWLGTYRTLFLPRQVPLDDLTATPQSGRIGCVATLDHGPNRQGIEKLASALALYPSVKLRIVGGPEALGRSIAAQFTSTQYCGRLSEHDLRAEAATWCAFANPIFCSARGASTKVAAALSWGLPVFTTPQGARGYRWPKDSLPLANTPADLAALLSKASSGSDQSAWFKAAQTVRLAAPTLEETAADLRCFLDSLDI